MLCWVTLAMAGARTLAMSVNRLADRLIDASNPRTAERHLPTGLLSPRPMLLAALAVGLVVLLIVGLEAFNRPTTASPTESPFVSNPGAPKADVNPGPVVQPPPVAPKGPDQPPVPK